MAPSPFLSVQAHPRRRNGGAEDASNALTFTNVGPIYWWGESCEPVPVPL